jgi:hypothetical protein
VPVRAWGFKSPLAHSITVSATPTVRINEDFLGPPTSHYRFRMTKTLFTPGFIPRGMRARVTLGMTALLTAAALAITPAMTANALVTRSGARSCPGAATLLGMKSQAAKSGYHSYETATQYAEVNFANAGLWDSGSPFTSAKWYVGASTSISSVTTYCY